MYTYFGKKKNDLKINSTSIIIRQEFTEKILKEITDLNSIMQITVFDMKGNCLLKDRLFEKVYSEIKQFEKYEFVIVLCLKSRESIVIHHI